MSRRAITEEVFWLLSRSNKDILELLLKDQTLSSEKDQYIYWATDDYAFDYSGKILPKYFAGKLIDTIQPRISKHQSLQHSRAKKRAEVFTPSWICNIQNNLIDDQWLGYDGAFNNETTLSDGSHSWMTTTQKVHFPQGKSWVSYILSKRMEMSCGEAPYIVSRYDTTTGEAITLHERIGILDRKIRIINENTPQEPTKNHKRQWLRRVYQALQAIYGFDWQGDNVFLARESVFLSFCEYYKDRWDKLPNMKSMIKAAEIISWNIWQMDGTTYTIPETDIPCYIMDWKSTTPLIGERIQFKRLINKNDNG